MIPDAEPSLHLSGTVARGAFTATIDLCAAPGEVVALLGPNGAGKSTVLRTVAGLEALRSGRLTLDRVLDDAGGTFVPAAERAVGTVFQDHRLFPHLSALDNVAFGPRARGHGRRSARGHAYDWLERLGVADVADQRGDRLSGGQAQRVAIARALAAGPRALVLDEPLAALDAGARGEVQRALGEHLRTFAGPSLLVTHDLVDALVLADRIVVLEDGRVVQEGPAGRLAARPASAYVAELMGLNLLDGPVVGGPAGTWAAVRPSAVRLTPDVDAGAGPRTGSGPGSPTAAGVAGTWRGTVASVTPWGERVRVEVDGPPRTVAEVPAAAMGPGLRPGSPVLVRVDRDAVELYPAQPLRPR